jgi:hypothetical protein
VRGEKRDDPHYEGIVALAGELKDSDAEGADYGQGGETAELNAIQYTHPPRDVGVAVRNVEKGPKPSVDDVLE